MPPPAPFLVILFFPSISFTLTADYAGNTISLHSRPELISLQQIMPSLGIALLRRWHGLLGLARQSPRSWYRDRICEELRERRTARSKWEKLSETSDVFFSIIRAQYDGYPVRKLPNFVSQHVPVYAYMLAKYTSRWTFYRTVAFFCNVSRYDLVREVVNPSRTHKLDEVARRYRIDPAKFKRVGCQLRCVWPLLP